MRAPCCPRSAGIPIRLPNFALFQHHVDRIYVDRNQNRDLTDDGPPMLRPRTAISKHPRMPTDYGSGRSRSRPCSHAASRLVQPFAGFPALRPPVPTPPPSAAVEDARAAPKRRRLAGNGTAPERPRRAPPATGRAPSFAGLPCLPPSLIALTIQPVGLRMTCPPPASASCYNGPCADIPTRIAPLSRLTEPA